jgi:UDP-N-acetylmuramyl pentapeptide phosphotransferase/UDP-N-acetylglucosamine-1-phosphate transferase
LKRRPRGLICKPHRHHLPANLWTLLTAFALSAAGGGLALLYTRRAGLIDIPNSRSSHSVPTPRGGGIAIVGTVLAVALHELQPLATRSLFLFLSIMAAIGALTLLGWLDDHGSIRVPIRLGVHVTCGVIVALLVNEIAPEPNLVNLAWLALWAFWTIASINIVNFMDGVDGMIGAQGIVYGIFLFALLPDSVPGARFGLIVAAACLGFLVWNWAPAKIFMGDVGSGPLGLFFVIGGALALQGAPPTLIFVPLFPLFLDALLTLVMRMKRREKLTDAHRSHLYQRLANGGWGHASVTSLYALGAAVGAAVAISVRNDSGLVMTGAIVAYVLFTLTVWQILHMKTQSE